MLDKTVLVLSSDNGFFFGEHGLTTERRLPYEESIRNPLLIRYPPRIPAGSRPEGLALTVDLAPTVLDSPACRSAPRFKDAHSCLSSWERLRVGVGRSGRVLHQRAAVPSPDGHGYRAIRTAR